MSRFRLPSDQIVQYDTPFSIEQTVVVPAVYNDEGLVITPERYYTDLVQYPAGIRGLSAEDREALGIVEIAEQQRPDDRFYIVTENTSGGFESTPRDLDQLKIFWKAQIDTAAYQILSQTDWKVVRAAEVSGALDAETAAYRSSVRAYANTKSDEIDACATVEGLIEVVSDLNWPSENQNFPIPN